MRRKSYSVQIWHLDRDPYLSAKYLSNKLLLKTIMGCIQALLSTCFYFSGIRSKKHYQYFFNSKHKEETLNKFFQDWPFHRLPSFANYDQRHSKWCRKCQEHTAYVASYLEALLLEHEFRFKKKHRLASFFDWFAASGWLDRIPAAHLENVQFEWKSLNPKYRNKDIILGYRMQFKAIMDNDGIKLTDFTNRDVPEFIMPKSDVAQWMI